MCVINFVYEIDDRIDSGLLHDELPLGIGS
jgi:hypothetical protein